MTLQDGVEIEFDGRAFHFLREREALGELTVPNVMGWEFRLLRNLANPDCADFAVQDWLDEFEIRQATLAPLLDILVHMGVLAVDWRLAA